MMGARRRLGTRFGLAAICSAALFAAPAFSQDDGGDFGRPGGRSEEPNSGFLGRMFPSSAARPRPPRPPKDNQSNGGFFVPLKSFSKAFKGRNQEDEASDLENIDPPRFSRPTREPFSAPPTARNQRVGSGARGSDDIEMRVSKLDSESIPGDVTEAEDEESVSSRRSPTPPVATSSSPSPGPANPTSSTSTTTVRNFSGSSVQPGPAARSSGEASTIGSGVSPKPANESKSETGGTSNRTYEATPIQGNIDTKGTSRRSKRGNGDEVLRTERPTKSAAERKATPSPSASEPNAPSNAPADESELEDTPSIPRVQANKSTGAPSTDAPRANAEPAPAVVPPPMLKSQPVSHSVNAPNSASTSPAPRGSSSDPSVGANSPAPLSLGNTPAPMPLPPANGPSLNFGAATSSPPASNDQAKSTPAAKAPEPKQPEPKHPEPKTKVIADRSIAEPTGGKANAPRNVLQGKSRTAIDARIPQVRLRVEGSEAILVGQSTPYEVIATNEGREPLKGLLVRAFVPTAIRITDASVNDGRFEMDMGEQDHGVVWELDELAPNSSKSLRLMLSSAQAEHFALGLDWTVAPPASSMLIAVQEPKLELAIEGASEVDYGQKHKYRMRVRNAGNAPAKGVRLEFSGATAQKQEALVGDVPAESERVVEVEFAFDRAGSIPIRVLAMSKESQLQAPSEIAVQVRRSNVMATWAGPAEFYEGSIAAYELQLENTGAIAAVDQLCTIELPAGVEVVQKPAAFKQQGQRLQWTIDRLEKNASVKFALQLAMNRSGLQELKFTSTGKTGPQTESQVVTKVDAVADLHLTVSDPVAPAPVGQSVVYELSITNRGKKAAEDVYVVAQFSDGIEPIRVDGHPGRLVPGEATFEVIPSIAPGATLVLKVYAEASKPGTHRFRAAVKCQGSEDDLLEEGSTRYTSAAVLGTSRK